MIHFVRANVAQATLTVGLIAQRGSKLQALSLEQNGILYKIWKTHIGCVQGPNWLEPLTVNVK